MLKLSTLRHAIRHVHMVQLLTIHVKEIRVSLQLGYSGYFVKIFESGFCDEVFLRCNECKLVKVTARNNFCVLILFQDLGNEFLGTLAESTGGGERNLLP